MSDHKDHELFKPFDIDHGELENITKQVRRKS